MDEKDKQIADLTAQVAEKDKQIADLTAEVKTQKTAAEIAAREVADAEKVISDLKSQLADVPASSEALPQLKIDKVTYELTTPDFNYKGQIVTLEVLKEQPKLAAELVKEGVSYLRKVQ